MTTTERSRSHLKTIAGIFVVGMGLLTARAYVVRGQLDANRIQVTRNAPISVLGDVIMRLSPGDSTDHVEVILQFFSIGEAGSEQDSEVIVGAAGPQATIERLDVINPNSVQVTRRSRTQARISIPKTATSHGSTSAILPAANAQIQTFRPPDSYFAAIDEGEEITIRYIISGAVTGRDFVGGWFHWYPFDTKRMYIPVRLMNPAILNRVEISLPDGYVGTALLDSLHTPFQDHGRSLHASPPEPDYNRIPVPAGTRLGIRGDFRRSRFTQAFLTLGILGISLIAGVLLGTVAKRPEGDRMVIVINGLGLVALPATIRAVVLSRPAGLSQFPTVVTAFDFIFALAWLLCIFAAVKVQRKGRSA